MICLILILASIQSPHASKLEVDRLGNEMIAQLGFNINDDELRIKWEHLKDFKMIEPLREGLVHHVAANHTYPYLPYMVLVGISQQDLERLFRRKLKSQIFHFYNTIIDSINGWILQYPPLMRSIDATYLNHASRSVGKEYKKNLTGLYIVMGILSALIPGTEHLSNAYCKFQSMELSEWDAFITALIRHISMLIEGEVLVDSNSHYSNKMKCKWQYPYDFI